MLLASFVLLSLLSAETSAESPVAPAHIPEVHATSFSNAPVNLPEGLRGKVGVLVLGFTRGSRNNATAWEKRLAADYGESATVLYFEMPVLASVPKMIRGFVIGQIKSSVSEKEKPRFVVLLDNEAAWRSVAHYQGGDDAYVLLVDEHGLVQWQTQAPPTNATDAALKQRVEGLRAAIGQTGR